MTVKAKLKIQLLADSVTVAESEDEHLWRNVLSAIQGVGGLPAQEEQELPRNDKHDVRKKHKRKGAGASGFAAELNVSVDELEGACTPINEPPYIHLDEKSWEEFKKNTPTRGSNSVAPLQLAGTLLCLWFKHAGNEKIPTTSDAQAILETIGERDKNASRSIKNCEWLQKRMGGLRINAAKHSRAIAIAKSYVAGVSAGTE